MFKDLRLLHLVLSIKMLGANGSFIVQRFVVASALVFSVRTSILFFLPGYLILNIGYLISAYVDPRISDIEYLISDISVC